MRLRRKKGKLHRPYPDCVQFFDRKIGWHCEDGPTTITQNEAIWSLGGDAFTSTPYSLFEKFKGGW